MKDFPFFTTQNGVASLILQQVPYSGDAYIRIHNAANAEEFLQECVDFARLAGARQVLATGHSILERYPLHTRIIRQSRERVGIISIDAEVDCVQKGEAEQFRQLYNTAMLAVANAAYMTAEQILDIISKEQAYFVRINGQVQGGGIICDQMLQGIFSAVPGAGATVLCALGREMTGQRIYVEVATANKPAMRFYEKMGFAEDEEIAKWYKIFDMSSKNT